LIIVVDGLTHARTTLELARLSDAIPRLRHFAVEQQGQNGALDQGVLAARGDIVLLLDDDVLPISPLASGHAHRHGRRGDLVVAGTMPVQLEPGTRVDVASRIYASAYDGHCQALARGEVDVLDSLWLGNVSLRRDRCLEVGIRSLAFTSPYHADRDFGYRLSDAGLVGVFDQSLRAVHLHTRSAEGFLRDAWRQGSGLRMLHGVHPDRLGPFTPEQLTNDLPRPFDLVFRGVVKTGVTRRAASVFLMRAATLAGRLGRDGAATYLAKAAQHIMQWHGAVAGEGA
jgi:hypothetical protein